MLRVNIRKSLNHVITAFKTEWRMIAKISWFPCFLLILSYFALAQIHFEKPQQLYSVNVHKTLNIFIRSLIKAICLTGIYRYLLKDSRFKITTFVIKRNSLTEQPVLWSRFYCVIDRGVIILASILATLALSDMLWKQLAAYLIIHNAHGVDNTFTMYVLMAKVWFMVLFFVGSQLCLIFPYIVTAKKVSFLKVMQNIAALKGNRIRVWAIQAVITSCIMGFAYILYMMTNSIQDGGSYTNLIAVIISVFDLFLTFMSWILLAIFSALLFKALGVHDDPSPLPLGEPEESAIYRLP